MSAMATSTGTDSVLILDHINNRRSVIIPEGSWMTCFLDDKTKIHGQVGNISQQGFELDGKQIRLEEIDLIAYQQPTHPTLVKVGQVLGGILSSVSGIAFFYFLISGGFGGFNGLVLLVILPALFIGLVLLVGPVLTRFRLKRWGPNPRRNSNRYPLKKRKRFTVKIGVAGS